jgi:AraC-like DNA-binding protein
MPDRLQALLNHFSVTARTFHSGALCGINSLEGDDAFGQLHLIRSGEIDVRHGAKLVLQIREPSLLLYPRPMAHRFLAHAEHAADLVCANIRFEGGSANPIVASLPAFVCLPLNSLREARPVVELLFAEAFAESCGRQAMLDRLFEIVLIYVLRELMARSEIRIGMLAGLTHRKLRLALIAIHEEPQREWSLEELASISSMSRSAFASAFREVIGVTPGAYLQSYRIRLAQKALLAGKSLKHIAIDVGYGSEAALSRAFKAQSGKSPREWKHSAITAA